MTAAAAERELLTGAKRVVVKIGSRLLADSPASRPATIADQVVALRARGVECILVSSGAIALGVRRLRLSTRPTDLPGLQAAAAVGQSRLMQHWEHAFAAHDLAIGQVLLTHDDLGDRRRFLSARQTLRALLDLRVVPIINENDTVATEEIKFGDNDQLAALVCNLVSADALIILTDVEGVRGADGIRMPIVRDIEREAVPVAGGSSHDGVGSGGMASKVGSARIVTRTGVPAVVAPGREPDVIARVLAGDDVGTLFVPAAGGVLSSRKHWIAYGSKPAGKLTVDDGAARALRDGGKSLLPAGVTAVDGAFELGDTVSVLTGAGVELARGLAAYGADDLRKIQGLQSAAIEARLGYRSLDEAIHRDDLVILISRADQVRGVAVAARTAARIVAKASAATRTAALTAIAAAIEANVADILAANSDDVASARAASTAAAMVDRLTLNPARVAALAAAVREIAAQPELVGHTERTETRPNGLEVARVRIPLGVIAMIYEARPNVTVDAAALCLKAGNACILRGGREAHASNRALLRCVHAGLAAAGLPAEAVQTLPTLDREAIAELVQLDELIDLCIPRGGEGLIRYVAEHARVPVIKHYKGVCHIYVHAAADLELAERVVDNAKTQRPGTCNACETVLVDRAIAAAFIPRLAARFANRVELRGDEAARALGGDAVLPATEDDWHAEYLDLILAVRVVDDLPAAVAHIEQYGSSHTESIITRDTAVAERFVREVDSSTVMINASTRFADGGELGLGAEIGISTTRLHAYGPMGAEGLTTTKFVVRGAGQVRT